MGTNGKVAALLAVVFATAIWFNLRRRREQEEQRPEAQAAELATPAPYTLPEPTRPPQQRDEGPRCQIPLEAARDRGVSRLKDGDIWPSPTGEEWMHGFTVTTISKDFCSLGKNGSRPKNPPAEPLLPADVKAKANCDRWLKERSTYFKASLRSGAACTFETYKPKSSSRPTGAAESRMPGFDKISLGPTCLRYFTGKIECYTGH